MYKKNFNFETYEIIYRVSDKNTGVVLKVLSGHPQDAWTKHGT